MSPAATIWVISAALLLTYYLNWGLLLAWTMLLAGVVGGKTFIHGGRRERLFQLLALGYLVMAVFALIVPQWLSAVRSPEPLWADVVRYGTLPVFPLMLMLPGNVRERAEMPAEVVDYIYGVMVFLLLAVIVLGSISFAFIYRSGYGESLLTALALVSGILLLLGFMWDPHAGFGGLGRAVTQHVMSLGLPIEGWLEALSRQAKLDEDPERFLAAACREMVECLPGLAGVQWTGVESHGQHGERATHSTAFIENGLRLELHTRFAPGPALRWDYDLAMRLLAEHYLGKRRAQELKRLSYIEAIHETGARLTHDVKNLLQSLETLCVAAGRESRQPSAQFNDILRRQLSALAIRLRQTLTKLAAPGTPEPTEPMPARAWLDALAARYADEWIRFSIEGVADDCLIAAATMFSGVAENLLQNAIDKRRGDAALRVEVRLICRPEGARLEVEDSGTAIPDVLAQQLLGQRVLSENGLGIGLYQSARLAEQYGYRLALTKNRAGSVRFGLAPASG